MDLKKTIVDYNKSLDNNAECDEYSQEREPTEVADSRHLLIRETNKQLKKAHQTIEDLRLAIISKVSVWNH